MTYAVGSLVSARGREWIVLPGSDNDLLVLRPLGGSEEETTGIYLPLEKVESATFGLPDSNFIGDFTSGKLLQEAIKLGFRSSAGPFRCIAKVNVEPRPYQFVPLLLALKQDPIRILIADDVGIGKTVEACLIARELLDRGEVKRTAVLCPPHLAEQWKKELQDKFNIDSTLVLSSTAKKLEKHCGFDQSLFDVYKHVIVSLDFIKSDRRRDEFLRSCPELVIVDEAHTCAWGGQGRSGKHQRFQLLKELSNNQDRHVILVTATPHSGKEDAFRSLLGLLNPKFVNLPVDLGGKENEAKRIELSKYFVQRRRGDIRHYLKENTPFPDRLTTEVTYKLSKSYKKFLEDVIEFAKESIDSKEGPRRRIAWWSAIALLRTIASSPAAAELTMKTRAAGAEQDEQNDIDDISRKTILDLDIVNLENIDQVPGVDEGEDTDEDKKTRAKLLELVAVASDLKGKEDIKLNEATKHIKELIKEKHHPIIFCRFIATAEYVGDHLRKVFKSNKNIQIECITGQLPPAEREQRIDELGKSDQPILVCTDCLSEGINLQEHFDAVFHYDLAWNPTRHEQREGRVDRYGQDKDTVKVITYYGTDNYIDGIILEILLKKHENIRKSLGVSVPIPLDANQIVESIMESLLLKKKDDPDSKAKAHNKELMKQAVLPGFENLFEDENKKIKTAWENAAEKEKRSRTLFAQHTIKPEDVEAEVRSFRDAIGSPNDIEHFVKTAVRLYGGYTEDSKKNTKFNLNESHPLLKEQLPNGEVFNARFSASVGKDVTYLHRTHPFVGNLASFVIDTALNNSDQAKVARCGAIRTQKVQKRTTILLVRHRMHIILTQKSSQTPLLAEDVQVLVFTGSPENAVWLENDEAKQLLNQDIVPDENIHPQQAKRFVDKVIQGNQLLMPYLEEQAKANAQKVLEAHQRVRDASNLRTGKYKVEPNLPPDILGIYVLLPMV